MNRTGKIGKRRAFAVWEVVVILVILAIIAAFVLPVFQRPGDGGERGRCQSNLKLIGLGFIQYTQDYDNRFPPVKISDRASPKFLPAYGWADTIQPYIKSIQVYQCPSNGGRPRDDSPSTPADPQYIDYWFNARVARWESEKIGPISQTFLAGDGNDGTEKCDGRYAMTSLPIAWRKTANSPALRHRDGANYLFADGHVKWLTPDRVLDGVPSLNDFGFDPGKPVKPQ